MPSPPFPPRPSRQDSSARAPRSILRPTPSSTTLNPSPNPPIPRAHPPPSRSATSPYHHHHTSSSPELRPRADNTWAPRARPYPHQPAPDRPRSPNPSPPSLPSPHIVRRPDTDDSHPRRSGFAARVNPHFVPAFRGRSASDVRVLHTPPPDLEPDRLARACGQLTPITPYRSDDRRRQSLVIDHPSSCLSDSPSISPSHPPLPKARIAHMYRRLDTLARRSSHRAMDYVSFEDVALIHKRDSHLREQLRRKRSDRLQEKDPNFHAVGAPLEDVLLYASTPIVIGEFQHYLPIVVVACVEELTKTGQSCSNLFRSSLSTSHPLGIYQSGLFRALPSRDRHLQLIDLFDKSSDFGGQFNMRGQAMPDICALLSTFISSLPTPLLDPPIYSALWHWSVKPSVQRADACRDRQEEEEEDRRARGEPSQRGPWVVHTDLYLDETDAVIETDQLAVAQILLRFLPSASLSLLVYLCAFFTQLPLCPENGLQLEDVARIFGHRLLGGSVKLVSQRMLMWLLTRWHRISEGLFGDMCGMTPPPSPTHQTRVGEPCERIEKRKGKRESASDDALRHAASCSSSASTSSRSYPTESPEEHGASSRKSSSDGEEDGESSEGSRRRKKRELDTRPRTHGCRTSTRKEPRHGHGGRGSRRHHHHHHAQPLQAHNESSPPDPFAMAFAKAQAEIADSSLLTTPLMASASTGMRDVGARLDTPARLVRHGHDLVHDHGHGWDRATGVDVELIQETATAVATGATRALAERVEVLERALGLGVGVGSMSGPGTGSASGVGAGTSLADVGLGFRGECDVGQGDVDVDGSVAEDTSGSEGKGKGKEEDEEFDRDVNGDMIADDAYDGQELKDVEDDLRTKLRRVEAERDEAQRIVRDMRAYLLDEAVTRG